jgi:hypothetical protein
LFTPAESASGDGAAPAFLELALLADAGEPGELGDGEMDSALRPVFFDTRLAA